MGAIPGVVSVMSGYTGGRNANPTYENHPGHYEAVRVRFDPNVISYRQLVDRYWRLTDPTDDDGQFCDRGTSYRPAIFVTPAQRADAEASKAAIIASGAVNGRVITQILPLGRFTEAEHYHRDYARETQSDTPCTAPAAAATASSAKCGGANYGPRASRPQLHLKKTRARMPALHISLRRSAPARTFPPAPFPAPSSASSLPPWHCAYRRAPWLPPHPTPQRRAQSGCRGQSSPDRPA
jgi:methionine-S-sulfoxide reductase